MRSLAFFGAALAAVGLAACAGSLSRQPLRFSERPVDRRLVVLHVSDLESELVAAGHGGGLGRFAAVAHAIRARAAEKGEAVVFLGAGDTFMPAPALQVELDGTNAVALANGRIGLQASALGNHEFDRGEAFLAEMVAEAPFPYLTSTVEFHDGPMAALAPRLPVEEPAPWAGRSPGVVLPRARICAGSLEEGPAGLVCRGVTLGLVGATTETLASVASTRVSAVSVSDFDAVLARVQTQVDALAEEGVDIVILLSHLQDIRRELSLVDLGLTGVDVIIGGGGDDRLANPGQRLLPGDEPDPICADEAPCYPLVRRARDGRPVIIAATDGQYRYVGELDLRFDSRGVLTGVGGASRPWPVDDRSVAELGARTVQPAAALEQRVRRALEPLSLVVARASVYLDGDRESVRNRETNLGDLSADSMAWAARAHRPQGAPPVAFALRNGGGIRGSIGTVDREDFTPGGGPVRLLDIEAALRFDNPIVLVTTTHRALKEALEASLRGAGTSRGHFPQVSGDVFLAYDPAGTEQMQDLTPGPGAVHRPGARVRTLTIRTAGGTIEVVRDGRLPTPEARITFATLDYLARGGDGYFPSTAPSLNPIPVLAGGAPVREQQALRAFLRHLVETGAWRGGRAYPDPDPAVPASFQRIRVVHESLTRRQ